MRPTVQSPDRPLTKLYLAGGVAVHFQRAGSSHAGADRRDRRLILGTADARDWLRISRKRRMSIDCVGHNIALAALAGMLSTERVALAERGPLVASILSNLTWSVLSGVAKKNIVANRSGRTIVLSFATAQAADTVTIQLNWVAAGRSQVTLWPMMGKRGSSSTRTRTRRPHDQGGRAGRGPPQVIAGVGADVVVDWMP